MSDIHHHPEGHRDRLRSRFLAEPESFSQVELLELLLTFAIPRKDVSPLAGLLLERFGDLSKVLSAPASELMKVDGIGEATAVFLKAVQVSRTAIGMEDESDHADMMKKSKTNNSQSPQMPLFQSEGRPSGVEDFAGGSAAADTWADDTQSRTVRLFANDEIAHSLQFLPRAANFTNLEDFRSYLISELPYNSETTRIRRANYILDRFYPSGDLNTALTYFAARCSSTVEIKPVVFYHILKAEPIVARMAEELIWPALPIGRVDREQIREFILRYLPDSSASSQTNMLRSVFYTYDLCSVGRGHEDVLRFGIQTGTLESFLYLLTREYPEPGIYSFESLFTGPLHRWLLWDREWLRRQLYNLRDLDIVTKIAEIDTVRQFTLALNPKEALHRFFDLSEGERMSIRERPPDK